MKNKKTKSYNNLPHLEKTLIIKHHSGTNKRFKKMYKRNEHNLNANCRMKTSIM